MADKKISALTAASALAGTEVLPVVQSSETKKATITQILTGQLITEATTTRTLSATDNGKIIYCTADRPRRSTARQGLGSGSTAPSSKVALVKLLLRRTARPWYHIPVYSARWVSTRSFH